MAQSGQMFSVLAEGVLPGSCLGHHALPAWSVPWCKVPAEHLSCVKHSWAPPRFQSLLPTRWCAGLGAWTSSLVLGPPPWAARVLLEPGSQGAGFQQPFCPGGPATLALVSLKLHLALGQWSGAAKAFPSPARGVWCHAWLGAAPSISAEHQCRCWMKAFAPRRRGETASSDSLPSRGSVLGALGTQRVPAPPRRTCCGPAAAWCPPSAPLRLQLLS